LPHPGFDYDSSALPPGIFNRSPACDWIVVLSYRGILKAAMLEAVGRFWLLNVYV
jgi:hypothetical protein